MPMNLDNALGIHLPAVLMRGRRAELLAANLANADTPNYKARDIDFNTALAQAAQSRSHSSVQPVTIAATHGAHMTLPESPGMAGAELLYRVPNQPSLDGNTVDTDLEKARFAENALRYQASLDFLDRKFRSLRLAIKGE